MIAALVLSGSVLGAQPAPAREVVPPNVKVDPFYRTVVDELLAASPTFARQCDRIANAPSVRVSVQLLRKLEESCCRARTIIERYSAGAIIASVEIPSPRTRAEYAELLGHEFEHILEQIDRVNLGGASDGPGITRLEDGSFETARARRAGTIVAMEMEAAATTPASFPPPQTSITPVRDR